MGKWRPSEIPASVERRVLYHIVLPQMYHHDVLHMAYETPMADHLGVKENLL